MTLYGRNDHFGDTNAHAKFEKYTLINEGARAC
jgi:hypothetical protein